MENANIKEKSMCSINTFNRIRKSFDLADKSFKMFINDEEVINRMVYDLQQTVEKTLKAYLEWVGVTIPKTHDIGKLISMSYNNGSHVKITEWIDDNSYMLTSWEAESRYNIDFNVEMQKVVKATQKVEEFLNVNGLVYKLDENINDEIKAEIRQFLPKDEEPHNDLEWNVYYRLYMLKGAKREEDH
jgi:HEPN domain-containing protein